MHKLFLVKLPAHVSVLYAEEMDVLRCVLSEHLDMDHRSDIQSPPRVDAARFTIQSPNAARCPRAGRRKPYPLVALLGPMLHQSLPLHLRSPCGNLRSVGLCREIFDSFDQCV